MTNPSTPEGTPELAALRREPESGYVDHVADAYRDGWNAALDEVAALRAADHRPDVEYCHHCGGQCEFDFALATHLSSEAVVPDEEKLGLNTEWLEPLIEEIYQRGLDGPEAAWFIATEYGRSDRGRGNET